jgi:hypothetical protein
MQEKHVRHMGKSSRTTSIASRWRWLAPKIWGSNECEGWAYQYRDGLDESDLKLINRRVQIGPIEADGRRIRLTATGRKELRLPNDCGGGGVSCDDNSRIAQSKK